MSEAAGNLGSREGFLDSSRDWILKGHTAKKIGVAEKAKIEPILATLTGPERIKALSNAQLQHLACEIRERLMDVVSRNGGHLSSNLGVVELTIALHRQYDFRRDRLIFDVGHQAYVHKLLTGRHAKFDTLRKQGGICGYPNPKESEYDLFLTGHAGTAISSALGLAACSKIKGDGRRTVAIVGDGAMTCGMSLEAINHAGAVGADLLVILNDNELSISRTTGALSHYLSRVRSWSLYNDLMDRATRLLHRLPLVGRDLEQIKREVVDRAVGSLTAGVLFEEFGFRYYGPVDGHNFESLFRALQDVSFLKGPVLLHVMTQKGRGFSLTVSDPVAYHSPAPFTLPGPETKRIELAPGQLEALRGMKPGEAVPPILTAGNGEPAPPVLAAGSGNREAAEAAEAKAEAVVTERKKTPPYTDVMMGALMECARSNDRIVAITAAMPTGTGLSAFAEAFPNRYYDVGICEPHAVTFAAGLAKAGLRPVVCIYSTFLQRAADNLMHDISLQDGLPVIFLMDRAGLVGTDGATHNGVLDLSYTTPLPHFVCMAPKDGAEAAAMLRFALTLGKPVGIRYPRDKVPGEPLTRQVAPLQVGKGEILQRGEEVAILAYGSTVAEAMTAAEDLEEQGIRITVANARFAKPVDGILIEELIRTHRRVITAEEHQKICGFGAMVMAEALARGLDVRKLSVLGIWDGYVEHASRAWQLAYCGLDAAGLAKAAREALESE